jgi:hypothetical protein
MAKATSDRLSNVSPKRAEGKAEIEERSAVGSQVDLFCLHQAISRQVQIG